MSRLQTPYPVGAIREAPLHLVRAGSGRVIPFGRNASSDAARGTALLAAVAAQSVGDTLLIGPGTFDLGTTNITSPAGVCWRGVGRGITTILATFLGSNNVTFHFGSNSRIYDLTLDGFPTFGVGLSVNDEFATNVEFHRCDLANSIADTVMFNHTSGGAPTFRFFDCTVAGAFDGLTVATAQGALIEYYRGKVVVPGGAVFQFNGGTINCYGTELVKTTDNVGVACVWIDAGTGSVNLHGCIVDSIAVGAELNSHLRNDTGTIRIDAATIFRDAGVDAALRSVGTITRMRTYGATPTSAGLDILGAANAAAQRTALGVISGTYTPTLTNGANVAASAAYECMYTRIGDIVIVAGRVDVDPTSGANVETRLGISLPIASNLAAIGDLAGVANSTILETHREAAIIGDTSNDRADFVSYAASGSNQAYFFQFTYKVLA